MRTMSSALPLLLAGCFACSPGVPNGKYRVLFFDEEYPPGDIAAGLTETISIPSQRTVGDHPKSLTSSRTYRFDFSGTTLDATGANGTRP